MKKIYIVTGANGHLGGTLVRMLSKRGEAVRGLVLPGEAPQPFPHVRYYTGDVRDADSMRPLFADAEDAELLVLHTAGLVDIADAVSDRLYDVNVNGTKTCWRSAGNTACGGSSTSARCMRSRRRRARRC